jgi:sarcosine oxidase, subunit gamma
MSETLKQIPGIAESAVSVPVLKHFETPGIFLSRPALASCLNIRGNPGDPSYVQAIHHATGVGLPLVPNTSSSAARISTATGRSSSGRTSILWLGPDEWLIVTTNECEIPLEELLRRDLSNTQFALTDVTCNNIMISLSGRRVRDVLAKGCSVDLRPQVFGAGSCAQTHVAKAGALIWQPDESAALNLFVRRSFSDYLLLWIQDAAQEYGTDF